MSLSAMLDKRITLQVLSVARDAAGQPGAEGWVDVVTDGDGKVWAGIKDLGGQALIVAQAAHSEVQSVITMRYREGIKAGMRALFSADVYKILAVTSQDCRKLQLMCSRVS
jgi:SPP1 family predicted phage head-tail adaptor